MNLEQMIHERWAADAALAALLPVERLTTGRAIGATLPYATLIPIRRRTRLRTNAASAIEEVTLRIDVWHDDYQAGRAIRDQVKASFDRRSFALADGSAVVHMRWPGDTVRQHEDGVWLFSIDGVLLIF
jgi:hypothetical protein